MFFHKITGDHDEELQLPIITHLELVDNCALASTVDYVRQCANAQVYKTQAFPVRPWGSSGFYITACFPKAGLALMLPRSSRRKRRQASCPCSPGAPWPSSSPAKPYAALTSRHALLHLHACSLTPLVYCLAHLRASRVHALTKPCALSLILFRKVGSGGGGLTFRI